MHFTLTFSFCYFSFYLFSCCSIHYLLSSLLSFPLYLLHFRFLFFQFHFCYVWMCVYGRIWYFLHLFFSLLPFIYTFYLFGGKSITWLCVSVRVCTSFFSSFISFRFCLLILLLILLRCFYSLFFAFFFFSSFFLVLFFCYLILESAILWFISISSPKPDEMREWKEVCVVWCERLICV